MEYAVIIVYIIKTTDNINEQYMYIYLKAANNLNTFVEDKIYS